MNVEEGDILGGKYRVEKVLGRGGMGVVVAAFHLQLHQRVALKFLLPEALQRPEMLARFSREARAAAKIRSEHVARVIDVGSLETGAPYIVMEFLEGSDLSGYLASQGPLPVAHAAELTLEACEGLAEAHSLGIVHRDLKPANLFLARSPDGTACLKILDFGISKMVSPEEAEFNMTQTGAVVGSPYYMSPEQMRSSRAVDSRTDIWSLGVILYELVSGRVPFEAPTLPQLCGMILSDPPPALGQWRPDVPRRFQELVSRCLEKDPALRFPRVADLAVALAEFAPPGSARLVERILRLSGEPAPPSAPAAGALAHAPAISTDWGHTSPRGVRSRGSWGILTAGFVLAIGLASWVLLRGPTGSSHRPDVGSAGETPPASAGAAPSASGAVLAPPPQESAAKPLPAVSVATVLAPAPMASAPAPPGPRRAPVGPHHAPAPSAPAVDVPPPSSTPKAGASPLDGRM